jgi:signal transduction histidine kinase
MGDTPTSKAPGAAMPLGKRRSVVTRTLVGAGLRIAVLVPIATALSLPHTMRVNRERVFDTLDHYNRERAAREGEVFSVVREQQKVLREEAHHQLGLWRNSDPEAAFATLMEQGEVDVVRSELQSFDAARHVSIRVDRPLDVAAKRRAVALHAALQSVAVGWRARITETLVVSSDGFRLDFRPMANGQGVWGGASQDSSRHTRTTSVRVDPVSKTRWVSLIAPIDDPSSGDEIALVVQSLQVEDVLRRALAVGVHGTASVLVTSDGEVVGDGRSDVRGPAPRRVTDDARLEAVFAAAKSVVDGSTILEVEASDDYAAVTRLPGTDWLLMTLYPRALVRAKAFTEFQLGIALGFGALVGAILVLHWMLKRHLESRLARFSSANEAISRGDFVELLSQEASENDELGDLARSHTAMMAELKRRGAELARYTAGLERLVEERTRDLATQRAQAEGAARLVALGEMAGGIAHEINNPLAVILASIRLLERSTAAGTPGPVALAESLDRVKRSSEHIAGIVQNLRYFSRDGAGDGIATVSVRDIVEDALKICGARLAAASVAVKRSEAGEGITFSCRKVQVTQALMHLLANAYDAVRHLENPWIEIDVVDLGDAVAIAVVDSGAGVPDAIADKIMQPFFTTKRLDEGSGLGLSSAEGIARQHGGHLHHDRASRVTRFVMTLPKQPLSQAGDPTPRAA